mgnify:CR=1 FL=1
MQDALKNMLRDGIVLSPYGKLLGMEPVTLEEDHVVVAMPFKNDITTVGDMVHGGAIASLVDVAATGAFWALKEPPKNPRGTTIGFSINYLDAGRAQTRSEEHKSELQSPSTNSYAGFCLKKKKDQLTGQHC